MSVSIKKLRLVRFDGRDDPGQCDLPGAKVGDEVAQVLMVEFPLYPGNLPPSTCTFGGGQMMYDVFLNEPPPSAPADLAQDKLERVVGANPPPVLLRKGVVGERLLDRGGSFSLTWLRSAKFGAASPT
jgi:hypothetical protein